MSENSSKDTNYSVSFAEIFTEENYKEIIDNINKSPLCSLPPDLYNDSPEAEAIEEDTTDYFAQVAEKLGLSPMELNTHFCAAIPSRPSSAMCSPWSLWSNFLSPGIDKQAWKHIRNCEECKAIAKFLDEQFDKKTQKDYEETDEFRKLVTLRQVEDLQPIPGADRIEVAVVGGWKVVVKKGEFKVGDYGVYFEIDSWLPDKPVFSFLDKAPREYRGSLGYRLKTIKLRGQISQGLLLPTDSFPEIKNWLNDRFDFDNRSLTQILEVKKWERVYKNSTGRLVIGRAKGNFPHFIQKTDEERLQNMLQVLDANQLGNHVFEVTTKMDGSSLTAYVKDGQVGVCSRNLELKNEEGDHNNPEVKAQQSDFWTMAKRINLPELLTNYYNAIGRNIALQGEFVGPGINGNYQKLKEWDFYLFNIYDIDKQAYMVPDERRVVWATYFSSVKHVPVVNAYFVLNPEGKERHERFDELMKCVDGVPSPTDGVMAEGVVFKDVAGTHHFKLISNNYLLKYDSQE